MYKFKSSQQVYYSVQAFQNGRFALFEIPSREKRFSLQDRSEGFLFLSATVHELKKVCEICLVRKSLRVSLPLLWIRACSQDIFKTIKGTKSSTEAAEYSSNDTSRRYSSNGQNIRGNFNESRHIGFSASTSEFCHKSEKISSETITTNRVFRPKNRCPHHDFDTNRGKYRKGNSEMPESPFSLSNQCFGIKKIDRSDVLNCPSNSLKLRYLQEQQLQSLNQACSYQAKTVLKSLSKQELLWRVENLRSNNQRSLGTKFSDTNRCIKIRLGRILQRGVN